MTNLMCQLPAYCIAVERWEPHPCGGYQMHDAWCYGPSGRIGYWIPGEYKPGLLLR